MVGWFVNVFVHQVEDFIHKICIINSLWHLLTITNSFGKLAICHTSFRKKLEWWRCHTTEITRLHGLFGTFGKWEKLKLNKPKSQCCFFVNCFLFFTFRFTKSIFEIGKESAVYMSGCWNVLWHLLVRILYFSTKIYWETFQENTSSCQCCSRYDLLCVYSNTQVECHGTKYATNRFYRTSCVPRLEMEELS